MREACQKAKRITVWLAGNKMYMYKINFFLAPIERIYIFLRFGGLVCNFPGVPSLRFELRLALQQADALLTEFRHTPLSYVAPSKNRVCLLMWRVKGEGGGGGVLLTFFLVLVTTVDRTIFWNDDGLCHYIYKNNYSWLRQADRILSRKDNSI